jgi:tryptophan-rich sensory protein
MTTATRPDYLTPRNLGLLVAFLALVLGVGIAIGVGIPPGDWYAGLEKPWFNPPNWLFGPAWTILYILIAVAGWRTFLVDRAGPAMKLWIGQMLLNWSWTPVFFGLHRVWPALGIIVVLAAVILAFVVRNWSRDRLSSILLMPYLAWVGFAALLNAALAWLNG